MDEETIHQDWTIEVITPVKIDGIDCYRVVVSYFEPVHRRREWGVVHLSTIAGYEIAMPVEDKRGTRNGYSRQTRNLLPGDRLWCEAKHFCSWRNGPLVLSQSRASADACHYTCLINQVWSPREVPFPLLAPPAG